MQPLEFVVATEYVAVVRRLTADEQFVFAQHFVF